MEIKKKGGRPEIESKRTKGKVLYFNSEEFEHLNVMYEEGQYQNLSDMIRDIIFNKQYVVISLDNNARNQRGVLIEEVKRIGNNFNQLIKGLNQKKIEHLTNEEKNILIVLLTQIKKIYADIHEQIEKI